MSAERSTPSVHSSRSQTATELPPSDQLHIIFTVIAGPHKGKVFRFSGHDTFIVGRSKRAHFQLAKDDKYFSRFHFLVEVNPPFCRLMDMGSRNGTWVNKERVTTTELKDGDLIRGGHTTLRVSMRSSEEEPGAP